MAEIDLHDPIDDFYPKSPFRRPCWRWGLAGCASEQRLPIRRAWRDPWLDRALRYRRRLRRARVPGARALARLDPEVHAALAIADGDPRRVFELQLRVLAGQPEAEIAGCCRIPAGEIEAFEALHYDLRPRLEATDYVHQQIQPRPPEPDVDGFLSIVRATAYANGKHTVDLLLRVVDERLHPLRIAGVPDPDPARTARMRDSVDFTLWAMTSEDHLLSLRLWRLVTRAEKAGVAIDYGALLRPISSRLWMGRTGDAVVRFEDAERLVEQAAAGCPAARVAAM